MKEITPFINGAWLTLMDRCNQRCPWCYRKESLGGQRLLDRKSARRMIKVIAQSGAWIIEFIGGEPTMYPHLVELTAYAKELGLRVALFTNGSLLNQAFIDRLQVDIYKITINSAFPEIHNQIAGANTFAATKQALDLLGEMGKLRTAMTVIGKINYDSAVESLERMLGWSVPMIGVSCAEPRFIHGVLDGEDSLHPVEYSKLISRAVGQLGVEPPIKYAFEAPLCLLSRAILDRLSKVNKILVGCAMSGKGGIVVDSDQSIIACQVCSIRLLERFPNSAEELHAQWDQFGITLESLMVTRSGRCLDCSMWDRCKGGCPMMWKHFNLAEAVQPF